MGGTRANGPRRLIASAAGQTRSPPNWADETIPANGIAAQRTTAPGSLTLISPIIASQTGISMTAKLVWRIGMRLTVTWLCRPARGRGWNADHIGAH